MNFFNWDESLSVHNSKMDDQHKQLIGYINQFYSATEKGNHAEYLKAFDKVIDFTTYHFKDEEALMEKANYPLLNRHKKIHEQLVNQVTELAEKLKANEDGAIIETKLFLKSWLTAHIKGIDMKYADYLDNKPQQQAS